MISSFDGLPPLRDIVARFDLSARKALGQNFLFDLNLTARIARASGPIEGRTIVEIGPGPGGLTRALLAAGAARVIAVERDERCLPALAMIAAHYPGRLEVVAGDALKLDLAPRLGGAQARIVANLPYNIATALLVSWLSTAPWPPWFDSLTLMFQREVADRLIAMPSTPDYGRLSVLAQWRCEAARLFDIAPGAFVPPPKVTSSVVHLTPRSDPLACDLPNLERVTAAAFGQRRKMLRSSLKKLVSGPEKQLSDLGIDLTRRGETLSISEFVMIANHLARNAAMQTQPGGQGVASG